MPLYPSSQHRKCSLHAAEPIVREQPPLPGSFRKLPTDPREQSSVQITFEDMSSNRFLVTTLLLILWMAFTETSPHLQRLSFENVNPGSFRKFSTDQWPPGAVVRPDHLWSGVMASLSLLKCSSSYFGVDLWFTHSGLCFKKSVMIVKWHDMIHAQEEESPQNLSNKWFILFFSFSEYICVLSICFLLLKTKPIYLSPISIAQDTATYPVAWQNNS